MTSARSAATFLRFVGLSVLSGTAGFLATAAVMTEAATPAQAQEIMAGGLVQVAGGKTDRLQPSLSRDAQGRTIRVVYPSMFAE
jgi:hypothetical protein